MEIQEQPTQYFEPPLGSEPVMTLPQTESQALIFPVPAAQKRGKRPFARSNSLRLAVESMIIAFLVMLFAASLMGAAWFYQSDLLAPGVTVMGLDIGQQNQSDAIRELQLYWDNQSVTIVNGLDSWSVHPSELGIQFDAAATVKVAHEQGRSWQSWQHFAANQGQFPIEPVWRLDPVLAASFLQAQSTQLASPPQNAHVQIVNGRVEIIPAVDGLEVDLAATQSWLITNAADVVRNGRLPLITRPLPAEIVDVSATAAQAEQLLTTAVTIHAYDPITDDKVSWVISPQIWGEWLVLDIDPADQTKFTWALAGDTANLFFANRMSALGSHRFIDSETAITAVTQAIESGSSEVDLRVFHQERPYTVQAGDTFASIGRQVGIPYPYIQAANPGVADTLSAGQIITLPSPDVLLPLPVVTNKRIVVSLSEQQVRVYENGSIKWDWLASTGIASSPTAPGVFQIQSHEPNAYAANWDLWMPNFIGVYKPVPDVDFMNGFHGFPTRDGVNLLWTQNLGAPVTYGCILLSNEHVQQLYNWAEEGVVVEVRP